MKILGVDIDSRKFGFVIIDGKKLHYYYFFESKDKEPQERIYAIYEAFKIQFNIQKPDIVFIEDSMYSQNYNTSRLIAETVGNCKLFCRLQTVPVYTVANKSWKKEIIGNGNCSKDDIKEFIIKKYKVLKDSPQDVLDATGVALCGVKRIKEKNGKV